MKTILIVEDDSDARSILEQAFRHRGYGVLVATHGAEGVYLARRNRPDLILMDLRMPVMDGVAALRYLKTGPDTRKIPIWAISADLSEGAERLLPQEGFGRWFKKPVDIRYLVAEVDQHFGAGAPPMPAIEIVE